MMKISYSGMNKYLDCPLQYKFQYVDKIYIEQDIRNTLVGSSLHDVLNKWYTAGDFQKGLAMEMARGIFDNYVKTKKVIWKPYENADVVFLSLKNQLDKTIDMIAKNNLTEQPLFSELAFEEPVGDLFILNGKIDLFLNKGVDSVLVDFKTSKTKYYTKPDQLALYSYAIFKKFNVMVNKCCYFFTSLEELDWYSFNQDFYKKLFGKFKRVVDGIQAKQFSPMPTKKICGWCPYKDMCTSKVE